MDPVSIALGLGGIAMKLFGGSEEAAAAKRAAEIQTNIAGVEEDINVQKRNQMLLTYGRNQMEVFRNAQRQRALAINAAVNQGASMGSGLQGGLAQIQNQSGYNSLGLTQNLEIGENIFGYNQQISGYKKELAGVQSQMASAQGLSSLGGALLTAGPTIGKLSQGFGNLGNLGGMLMGGGSPSGYGR